MDMSVEIYRELGELSANVKTLGTTVEKLATAVDDLKTTQAVQKGGNSALWKVGGSSATGAGILVAVLQYLGSLKGAQPPVTVPAAVVQSQGTPVYNSSDR